jgi:hypothetical protein
LKRARRPGAALFLLAGVTLAGPATGGGDSAQIDPAARLPAGKNASEYWDVTAQLTTGHRFFARFLITNLGPGGAVPFKNGRKQGRWQLEGAGRLVRIGSSVLDLTGPTRRVEVDNDKRGFKVHLEYAEDGSAARARESGGYHLDLLNIGTPVTGTVWHGGMSAPVRVEGRIAVSHTWLERGEAELAQRRIDVASLGGGDGVFLTDVTSRGGDWGWLGVVRDGRIVHASSDPRITRVPREGSGGSYPVPRALRLSGPGVHGTVSLGGALLQRDPLEALPRAIRMLYLFGSRPHRTWVDATVDVALKPGEGRAALPLHSPGVATLNFLESLQP